MKFIQVLLFWTETEYSTTKKACTIPERSLNDSTAAARIVVAQEITKSAFLSVWIVTLHRTAARSVNETTDVNTRHYVSLSKVVIL